MDSELKSLQISIGTDDVYKTANAVELQKGRTVRPPGPLPGIPTKIYVCLDPDDWKVVSYPSPILPTLGVSTINPKQNAAL